MTTAVDPSWSAKKDPTLAENTSTTLERISLSFVVGSLGCLLGSFLSGGDVYLETVIGKRIYFKGLSTGAYDFVIPDAVIDLSFWRRTWQDGKVHDDKNYFSESQAFLEIDRATNPITRLKGRIQALAVPPYRGGKGRR